MNRTFTILALAAASMLTISDANAITQEEFLNGEYPMRVSPPNDGDPINSLTTVNIYPNSKCGGAYILDNELKPQLQGPEELDILGTARIDDFMGFIQFRFEEQTTPGEYTLTVPEGLFVASLTPDAVEPTPNPELTFTYVIEAPTPIPPNPLLNWTADPAPGSTVTNINNNISITFPDVEWVNLVCIACVSVTDGTNTWAMYDWAYGVDEYGDEDRHTCVLNFKNYVDMPGEYTIVFEPETFKTFSQGHLFYNPYMSVKYKVGEVPTDIITLDNHATEPDAGSTVHNFNKILVKFPQSNAPEQGIESGNTDPAEIFIQNDRTLQVFYCSDAIILDDKETAELRFPKITENGNYTLQVPAGVWQIIDSTPLVTSPAFRVPYVLDYIAGAEMTEAEATVVGDVYDMTGRKVLDGATEADVKKLAPGAYIHAGRKVIVK